MVRPKFSISKDIHYFAIRFKIFSNSLGVIKASFFNQNGVMFEKNQHIKERRILTAVSKGTIEVLKCEAARWALVVYLPNTSVP